MEYYVYVYLDTKKPGRFIYGEYQFDYEPFYIGKGKGERYRKHLLTVKNGKYSNLPKNHIIKKILDEEKEPIILKYFQNIDEKTSFMLEEDMIKNIGRFDKKSGPLRNLSDGGEGPSGCRRSEETRKKLSMMKKGICTENMLNNLKKIHSKMWGNQRTRGLKFSDDTKKKMGESHYKSVLQLDLDENIIREFSSIKEAKAFIGYSIMKVLRGEGKTAGGYKWKYKDQEEDERRKFNYSRNQERKKSREEKIIPRKAVYKRNIHGEILGEYSSISEAAILNGMTVGNISKVLNNKGKTAGGFKWEYKK